MSSKTIRDNFSGACSSYSKNADIQQICARNLVKIAQKYVTKNELSLDLGSGTGFVSDNLEKSAVEVDFSLGMLKNSAGRLQVCADANYLPFCDESFPAIYSSFALQWIDDFGELFAKIARILSKNGIFAFCLPVFGSLEEIRRSNVASGAGFLMLDLPIFEEITSHLRKNNFEIDEVTSQTLLKSYDSGLSCLKNIKDIGASHFLRNRKMLSRKNIEKFNDFFLEKYNNSTQWEIKYFICHV